MRALNLPAMVACLILAAALLSPPASAQTMHAEAKVGKKLSCFAEHFHYGSSDNKLNKKIAAAEAIASWEGFVAFEYGNAYSDWRISASKQLTCKKDGFQGWGCKAWSRPCRRLR